ncbi:MAG TPA: glycosyl hydrolase family 65 protein [Aggregatilinea sp.]|uniref:glycoside hydrolase family 65 protein n=1 Tax=Aggregatilinea sp. TaxID=2806333 RepID=UPI002B66D92E|nr:glycosyl hydrolase family 65 protein [Aggregatilinea sp.]HML20655.1 glycosyl hydrolase family 65 protein [Aggregatilinea sp.]
MPPIYTFTDDGFTLIDTAPYTPGDEVRKATVFALANGYMSSRGAPEWAALDVPGIVGHHINGIYDTPDGDVLKREIINLPAWTPMTLSVDGETLDLANAAHYTRTLDMRRGLLLQEIAWQTASGIGVTLHSERLVSMDRLHLGAIRWTLSASGDCAVTLDSKIDAGVSNRFAEGHFRAVEVEAHNADLLARALTIEPVYEVVVMAAHTQHGMDGGSLTGETAGSQCAAAYRFTLRADQPVTLDKFVAVYDSRFTSGDLDAHCRAELDEARAAGYEAVRETHADRWAALWADSDVVIEGDGEAQAALRFCLFHLLANAPHDERVSISARGLQGQDYWGSIFWDYEMYVLPFFTATQPGYARRSLVYRTYTLDGARRKARGLGYAGAYYAWQSQETGDETCALYVFDDPFTGEKTRSYFADEQIHISADIAYAVRAYVDATGDLDFLLADGLPIVCEVARFFASRMNKDAQGRYHLLTVLGPDEYHERVDDDAYTNATAQASLDLALDLLDRAEEADPESAARMRADLDLSEVEMARWQDIATRLYVPEPDPATGLIEQFDGYFRLEDAPPDVVRARLDHPDRHPGGPLGPFQSTQAIKQADVVLLLYLLRERYSQAVKRANWEYYEPRTAHDSSLSPMAYALVAADIGRTEWAHRYFMQTAMLDLEGSGPHWNLGVHTAAMGGAWIAVVHGFCQAALDEDGVRFLGAPRLPEQWTRVAFKLVWHGQRVYVVVEGGRITLSTADGPIPVITPAGRQILRAGEPLILDETEFTPATQG